MRHERPNVECETFLLKPTCASTFGSIYEIEEDRKEQKQRIVKNK